MTSDSTQLRRLPWDASETAGGKPCFLLAESSWSLLSKVADEMENQQVEDARRLLDQVAKVTDPPEGEAALQPEELRRMLRMTNQALYNVIRVAECRGERLGTPDDPEGSEGPEDGPHLPAESFG